MLQIRLCKMKECRNAATTSGFCRLHYLQNWKKIKTEQKRKAAKNLNNYVDHIMKRFPDRFVDEIKKDIRSSSFDDRITEKFPTERGERWNLFEGATDEEIRDLVKDLKIGKDF